MRRNNYSMALRLPRELHDVLLLQSYVRNTSVSQIIRAALYASLPPNTLATVRSQIGARLATGGK
jgi:hypothetical protein